MYAVGCTSDKIWNINDLVGYLVTNQHNDIELRIEPEAICLHNLGLYDILDHFEFKSVTIHTWNPLEKHSKYKIKLVSHNHWFQQTAHIDLDLQTWNVTKRFLCLYHRPTAARLALAAHLWTYHSNTSLIHFSAKDPVDFELDKLLQWDVESTAQAGTMLPHLPLLLSSPERYTKFSGYDYNDKLTALYQSILIDVVVESHVAGKTFFPTEKTIRSILLKKPFIIFASRDFLAYLRQMGFRSFGDFWDENYDGYDGRDRLLKIKKLLDDLAQMPLDTLEKMYWDMQYSLNHNYDLLMSQKFIRQIKEIT